MRSIGEFQFAERAIIYPQLAESVGCPGTSGGPLLLRVNNEWRISGIVEGSRNANQERCYQENPSRSTPINTISGLCQGTFALTYNPMISNWISKYKAL